MSTSTLWLEAVARASATSISIDDPAACLDAGAVEEAVAVLSRGVSLPFSVEVDVLTASDGHLVEWRVSLPDDCVRYGAFSVEPEECGSATRTTVVKLEGGLEDPERCDGAGLVTWIPVSADTGLSLRHQAPGLSVGVQRAWAWERLAATAGVEVGGDTRVWLDDSTTSATSQAFGWSGGLGLAPGEGRTVVLPTVELFAGVGRVVVQDSVGSHVRHVGPRAEASAWLRALTPWVVVGAGLAVPVPRFDYTESGATQARYSFTTRAEGQFEPLLRLSLEVGLVISGRSDRDGGRSRP